MRYKIVTITPPTADLSGQLIRIKIDSDTDMGAVSAASGYDVFFTNAAGTAQLPFSRLTWNIADGAATGEFDVLCDIPVTGLDIRIYYGGEAFTDYQNRAVTYAGYLAVYPCNYIWNDNQIEDISGNGKHVTIPSNKDVHVYESPYGRMLQSASANNVGTSLVNLAYDGDVTMSCVTEACETTTWQILPGPHGYVPNGILFFRRYGGATNRAELMYYSNGNFAGYVILGAWANYASYTIPQASGTCVVRANGANGFLGGTFSKTWTRHDDVISIFPSGTSGIGQARDVRFCKGAVSSAGCKFEKDSLVGNIATFGSEVRITPPKRRHNHIMEAF